MSMIAGEIYTQSQTQIAFESLAFANVILARTARAIRIETRENGITAEEKTKVFEILNRAF